MINRVVLLISLVATALVFPCSLQAQEAAANPLSLDSILDSMEQSEEQNLGLSQPYEVTREYKVFRENDPVPVSDVMAQINFTPPETKTFQITKAEGSPRGKKIVSIILKQEIASAKDGHRSDITRSNYDFAFLREQNFGVVPEYVLHIIPKRKEKGLLLGDIWVNAKTYRIRQIVGVPLKNPSIWVEDLHVTVQFADVNAMWLPVAVDAIATVRFLGIYTLSALEVAPTIANSNRPSTFNRGGPR
jgi:hypothetical protein